MNGCVESDCESSAKAVSGSNRTCQHFCEKYDGLNLIYEKTAPLRRSVAYHGEFDPGSERTLAARFKHASRTVEVLRDLESGERVSNT